MMTPEDSDKLLSSLIAKTKERSLQWRAANRDGTVFRVNFPRSSIQLTEEPALIIFNSDGVVVDVLRPESFSDHGNAAVNLMTLYTIVRNAAFKVDETLEDIFS